MAKKSSRIQELRETSELSCIWGLFTGQARDNHKMISNGRPVIKHIIDNSRKVDQLASFDDECRKIQKQADLASITVDASERSPRNLSQENSDIKKQKNKQIIVKEQQLMSETESKLVMKTHKTARKKRPKTYESSLSQSNHLEELRLPEDSRRSIRLGKHDQVVRTSSESKPFSNALEVLNINKDLSMELFQEPDSLMQSCSKNGRYSRNIALSRPSRLGLSTTLSNTKSTSFSLRDMQKKLKHRFRGTRKIDGNIRKVSQNRSFLGDRCICRGVETENPLNVFVKKVDFKSDKGSDIACVSDTVRKKIDFSSSRLSENMNAICQSPLRIETSCDDEFEEYDEIIEILSEETNENIISTTDDMKSNGETEIVQTNIIRRLHVSSEVNSTTTTQRTETIENFVSDSLLGNETFTSTVDDYPLTPTSIYHLDMSENINKYQEEHRSPVSVLEQIFTEDANSPSSIKNQTQTARHSLQPRRLNFQECLSKSPSSIDEQDYISHYVHSVLEASCLNWDQLARIRPLSEELLHSSLFDEVEFLSSGSYVDYKFLFDHINEVLVKIHRSRFCCPPWLAFVRRKMISSVSLEEVVLDEIMKEAELYLLPRTEKRTLDQLVAKDLADSRSWFDVGFETEHVVIHIAEDILVESILDVILEFYL